VRNVQFGAHRPSRFATVKKESAAYCCDTMADKIIDVRLSYSKSLSWLIVAILAGVLLFAGFAVMTEIPKHGSLIMVSSSGSVTTVPDQASIYLTLNATGSTASLAISNLSAGANMLNTTMMPFLNENSSRIQTLSYRVYVPSECMNTTPVYYYQYYCVPKGMPNFYVASEYIQVRLPSISNLNTVLVQLAAVPGIGVSNVASTLSEGQQALLSQRALTLALANATSQASILAGSGAELSVRNITVSSGYVNYPSYASGLEKSSGDSQTFFSGAVSVSKSIYVVFNIEK